jgi:type I restriction enzyme M protein
MNLFLHNIGDIDSSMPISPNDSLIASPESKYDYVLAIHPSARRAA